MIIALRTVSILICIAINAIDSQKYEKMVVVPYNFHKGHLILYEHDFYDNKFHTATIAVLVIPNEIVFAALPDPLTPKKGKSVCITFEGIGGATNACDKFFVITFDYYKYRRYSLKKGGVTTIPGCTPIQFSDSVLVLIKYDVMDAKSPKYIGTYNEVADVLIYSEGGKRRVYSDFNKKIVRGDLAGDKFEVICLELFEDIPNLIKISVP